MRLLPNQSGRLERLIHAFDLSAVYGLEGEGRHGETKTFKKPWANTLCMFIGMAACLPVSYLFTKMEKVSEDPHNIGHFLTLAHCNEWLGQQMCPV